MFVLPIGAQNSPAPSKASPSTQHPYLAARHPGVIMAAQPCGTTTTPADQTIVKWQPEHPQGTPQLDIRRGEQKGTDPLLDHGKGHGGYSGTDAAGVPRESLPPPPPPSLSSSSPARMTNVQPPASWPPQRFRIGPDRYKYDYSLLPGVSHLNNPVYKCERGRDAMPGHLYLYAANGNWAADYWVAGQLAVPIMDQSDWVQHFLSLDEQFRSVGEVRTAGSHQWECKDTDTGNWWPASSFQTRLL